MPTTKTFLRRYLRAAFGDDPKHDTKLEFLACFLAELTLVEYAFLRYLPSLVASSAIFLANFTLGRAPWTTTLAYYTGYSPRDLRECVTELHRLYVANRTSNLPAIREKYSQTKFKCVSTIRPQPEQAGLPQELFLQQ